jgi:hypothetical protein
MGNEVHVVTSWFGAENRPKEEVINGVHIHRVKALRPHFPDLTYPLEYVENILRDADIVHGHSHNSLFAVKVVEEAKDLGIKTAMYFMAVDALYDYPNPLAGFLGSFYTRHMVRKAIELSDIRLVKSFRDLEILRSRYGVEALYVPDGVSEEIINAPHMAEAYLSELPLYLVKMYINTSVIYLSNNIQVLNLLRDAK